jgi:hypothetical protein
LMRTDEGVTRRLTINRYSFMMRWSGVELY